MLLKIKTSNALDNTCYLTHSSNKIHEINDYKETNDDIGAPTNNFSSSFGSPHTSNEP